MPAPNSDSPDYVLLLASAHSYRIEPFLRAAGKLGLRVIRGLDVPPANTGVYEDVLRLDFRDPTRSVRQAEAYARARPGQLRAVIPTDDATVTLAAHIARAMDLPHNSVASAEASRDKHRMRELFALAGVRSPWFRLLSAGDDPARVAREIIFPCVLKPTCLSGSRGVMRADDSGELAAAFGRLSALLATTGNREILLEGYIPGQEFALEGLLSHGRLTVLALFDKPDPLEGPFFEETIYVTPSRLPPDAQSAISACAASAARALGLREGAVHAEMRLNAEGPWLVELAGRSIGGLCSQTLRFAHSAEVSLEELILRQAVGMEIVSVEREQRAGGVMMIPVPGAGTLVGVHGLEAAGAVRGIESVEITARLNYPLVPLPEGESYVGFIIARGDTPEEVESALRAAHRELRFEIEPPLPALAVTSA